MSSKDPKKKKTGNYPPESLELALKEIRNDGKGIRETCRKYGIPRTTIQDRLVGKRTDELKNRGPEPILGTSGEKKVVEWLINIAKCGFPVKKQELLDTVQKILKDLRKPNPFKDDRPGQTWYNSFMKRNPAISLRSAEGINKARARVTEQSIRLWFRGLECFLSEERHLELLQQPTRIFNADESGFSLCPKTGKVIGPRGYRNLYQIKVGNEKDNLTVLVMFNANGQMCPPLVVFPYLRPPKAVSDSMPSDWILGRSESGWMKSDVFFEYITNDFNAWLEQNKIQKPILLLVDGHKSHMSLMLSSMCEQLGIILYALPPNTTHMLQPADVSVFAPLKCHWKKIVRNFLTKPENVNKSVTKTNFCQLLQGTIENPQMTSNIINGFRKCGLFPFDPNSVDYTKCVQNTMEQLNQPREQSKSGITNEDLISTRKVIRHLRPVLKSNKIDVKFILQQIKKLRTTEPRESQILYESGSEDRTNSTVHLSSLSTLHISGSYLEQGSLVSLDDVVVIPLQASTPTRLESQIISTPETSKQLGTDSQIMLASPVEGIEKCSTQPETLFKVPIANVEPISQSAEKACEPVIEQSVLVSSNSHVAIVSEMNLTASDGTLNCVSCSQPEGLLASLDDIIIMPAISEPPSFKSRTLISQSSECCTPSNISATLSHDILIPSGTTAINDSVSSINPKSFTNPHEIFKKHLFIPQPIEKSKHNVNKPRLPAAISNRKWRKFHEEKEKAKMEKKEAVKRKQEESKRKKLEMQAKKKKCVSRKAIKRNEQVQVVKQNCAQCTISLNSDTEDDDNKNVGCDFCTKWFHLKCTDFIGLTYDQVKDRPFKCNTCIIEKE